MKEKKKTKMMMMKKIHKTEFCEDEIGKNEKEKTQVMMAKAMVEDLHLQDLRPGTMTMEPELYS